MKAKNIEGQSVAGKRARLADKIPLDTPYLIQIFPVYACNFRCSYCIHSVNVKKRGFISDKKYMDFELYQKTVDDLKQFPQKIKMLRFAGTGEPLLHPQLPEMIRYAADMDIAESIDVVTNGSLLTQELSDQLINTGLSRLRISIQGVSSKRYREIAGVDISVENFIENIRYFFEHKKKTKLYIKTIDIDMSMKEKKQFYTLFGSISDTIAIEYLSNATHHIDYASITSQKLTTTQNGNLLLNAEVCPQPFYMMQVNPDGNIVPCCAMETAMVIGRVKSQSIIDIWQGKPLRKFQKLMLKRHRNANKICANCKNFRHGMFEEDLLDNHANLLLKKIN